MDDKNIKNIIDELGLSNLPKEKQDSLIIKMTEAILKRMFFETMEKLNEKDQETFGQMIDNQADPEEIKKFLAGKISNYDQLMEKIVSDFKKEMTSNNKS